MHNRLIQKSQKNSFSFTSKQIRKFSVVVAYYLSFIGVTANQVLFFRVIVFGGGALYFFYSESYFYNLIGLFLIALCHFFDYVDGDLARNHSKATELGGFLDGNFDSIVVNAIILTLTLRFYFYDYDTVFVISGIAILFGTIFSSKMTEIFRNRFDIGCSKGSPLLDSYLENHRFDYVSHFFYRLITPKGLPFSLLSNLREYLLIGIIFGIIPITFVGFAIAINLRWMLLFIFIAFYYRGISLEKRTLKIYELLKQSDTKDSW